MAELADAQGLGPCVLLDVEVRVLSLAVFNLVALEKCDGKTADIMEDTYESKAIFKDKWIGYGIFFT